MPIHHFEASFNAGELSPQMDSRVAVEKYAAGCRQLHNMVPLVHGPVTRRPGLEYMGAASSASVAPRLIGVDYAGISVVIEMGPGAFRFWAHGQMVSTAPVPHPYQDSELFAVQTVSVNDVIFLAHPNHHPKVLEFRGLEQGWRLRDLHEPAVGWTAAPPALPPPTGNAVCERWVVPKLKYFDDTFITYAKTHPPATVPQSGAPASLGSAYPALIQRVKGWFVPAATGLHRFRYDGRNKNTGCRIYLEPTPGGTGTDKSLILSNAVVGSYYSVLSGSYHMEAGKAYFVEFWLNDVNRPATGAIKYERDGGGFGPVTADLLAAMPTAGGQGDSLVGWPAMLDENAEDITVTPSGTTGAITLTASAPVWQAEHVGAWWTLAHRRSTAYAEMVGSANATAPSQGVAFSGSSDSVRIVGKYEVTSYGIWEGTVHLEAYGPAGWHVVRTWVGKKDRNISIQSQSDEETQFRITVESGAKGYASSTAAAPRFIVEAADAKIYGLVRLTSYTDATHVGAQVYAPLWSTAATAEWTEGVWSNAQGYPRAACLHEQRTVWGGTRKRPQSLWASTVGDFENFRRSSLDDGSWLRLLASENSHRIESLVSYDALIILTNHGFFVGESPDGGILTPTAGKFTRRSGAGAAPMQAVMANESILFVQANALTLRRLAYREDISRFGSADMTVLSDHITASGIRHAVWQGQRRSVVWCVCGDGRLIGMTLEEEQNVFAWHQHSTPGGQFLSVARIGGIESDEVWFAVRRGAAISIERFDPDTYAENPSTLSGHAWLYADSGHLLAFEAPSAEVTGLDHLDGMTVAVCADGATQPDKLVTAGRIALDPPAQVVSVGLRYESRVQKMKLELPMQDGASRGRHYKVCSVQIQLLNSGTCHVSDAAGERAAEVETRHFAHPMDAGDPLMTGQATLPIESRHRESVDVLVTADGPLPLTITGMVMHVDVSGN